MKKKLLLTEIWFKLVLLILFGLLYWTAIFYPEKSKKFPQLIAMFSLIMIMISLIMDFTQKDKMAEGIADVDDTELKVVDDSSKKSKRKRFFKAWGIILISTAIGLLGGFLFTTFFLFIGFALLFGEKKNLLKNTLIAVFLTVIIYFAFQWTMGVPLLRGILW